MTNIFLFIIGVVLIGLLVWLAYMDYEEAKLIRQLKDLIRLTNLIRVERKKKMTSTDEKLKDLIENYLEKYGGKRGSLWTFARACYSIGWQACKRAKLRGDQDA